MEILWLKFFDTRSFNFYLFCVNLLRLTVRFNFSPDNLSFSASWAEIREWLQAESQRTKVLEMDGLLDNFNSTIWSRPLTGRTGLAQVPLSDFTSRLAECEEVFLSARDSAESFAGYIFSAPRWSALWVLLQSDLLHFLDFGPFRKIWSDCRQEKLNFCSAAKFALRVGVLSLRRYRTKWHVCHCKQHRADSVV